MRLDLDGAVLVADVGVRLQCRTGAGDQLAVIPGRGGGHLRDPDLPVSSSFEAMSRMRSRACSAAKRTALPPMNVPREAKLPVHTADESVFVLSLVTHSKGTPSVSATICVCTVRDPWPMSTVPEKTSTRPSGLSLTQAWLGSPFWFMPVGYSIVAIPRPLCFAITAPSVRRGFWSGELGNEMLREQV